jgi:hypothetical protein
MRVSSTSRSKHPALIQRCHLLKNRKPRRIVVGHKPPLIAGSRNVANTVENSTQIVLPMRAVLTAQRLSSKYGSTNAHSPSETSLG